MDRFVCASANPDKVAEIASLLGGVIELLPRPEDVPDVVEDADTLIGNARLKALAICRASGLPAISDDTGLEVDALDGAPGVYTARFAGEHCSDADNRAKLLHLLKAARVGSRSARFTTVAMVVWPDGRELAFEGVCNGSIALGERGERGFGYVAVFVADEAAGRTFAEMSEAEKNEISHRGRAFRALVDALRLTS